MRKPKGRERDILKGNHRWPERGGLCGISQSGRKRRIQGHEKTWKRRKFEKLMRPERGGI